MMELMAIKKETGFEVIRTKVNGKKVWIATLLREDKPAIIVKGDTISDLLDGIIVEYYCYLKTKVSKDELEGDVA